MYAFFFSLKGSKRSKNYNPTSVKADEDHSEEAMWLMNLTQPYTLGKMDWNSEVTTANILQNILQLQLHFYLQSI